MRPEQSITAALITCGPRWDANVFGRPLLQRTLILCAREGVEHFYIRCGIDQRQRISEAVDGCRRVSLVESFESLKVTFGHSGAVCFLFEGDLVFAGSQLSEMVECFSMECPRAVRMPSPGGNSKSAISLGLLA